MNYSVLSLAMLGLAASGALAGKVYLGIDAAEVTNATASGVQTRFKIDNTNWDAMLGNGYQPISTGTIVALDVGNLSTISGVTYRYQVSNLVGEGLVFTLDAPSTPSVDFSMGYGTFAPGSLAPATTSALAPTLLMGGVPTPPQVTPYNALHLYSAANALGSQVEFANANFTLSDPGIQLVGALPGSGIAINSGTRVIDSYLAYFNEDGTRGDLSSVGWTFNADVTITGASGSNPKEGAKFEFTGKSLDYTPPGDSVAAVPETSAWVIGLLACGAALVSLRRTWVKS